MHWCQLGVRLDAWEMPDYWSLTEHGHIDMVHVWLYSAQNSIASVILNGGFLNLLLVVNIFTNLDDALGWFRWDQTSPNIKHKTTCDHWRVDSDWKDRLLYLHDELVLQQKYLPRWSWVSGVSLGGWRNDWIFRAMNHSPARVWSEQEEQQ